MTNQTNQTTRPAALHAYYAYRDAPAALGWLRKVLGFETVFEVPDDKGGIAHSELRSGDAAIVVFSDHDGYDRPAIKGETTGHGGYLSVAAESDVDAVHAAALDVGATVVWTPELTEWGNYRCRILDPEGFEWTVGTHKPGEPVGDWS